MLDLQQSVLEVKQCTSSQDVSIHLESVASCMNSCHLVCEGPKRYSQDESTLLLPSAVN